MIPSSCSGLPVFVYAYKTQERSLCHHKCVPWSRRANLHRCVCGLMHEPPPWCSDVLKQVLWLSSTLRGRAHLLSMNDNKKLLKLTLVHFDAFCCWMNTQQPPHQTHFTVCTLVSYKPGIFPWIRPRSWKLSELISVLRASSVPLERRKRLRRETSSPVVRKDLTLDNYDLDKWEATQTSRATSPSVLAVHR